MARSAGAREDRVTTASGWELQIDQLRAVTDGAADFVSLNGPDLRYLFVNRTLAQATGRRPEDFVGRSFEEVGFPETLASRWRAAFEEVAASGQPGRIEFEATLAAGTRLLHAQIHPIRDEAGTIRAFAAITRDITDGMRAERMRDSQDEVLRRIVSGATLQELLETIIQLAEENLPNRPCSLMLLGPGGNHLVPGHAPSVPAALIEGICNRPIGPGNASCGLAAHERRRVVCEDIGSDPHWTAHREVALWEGLRACWSEPILASNGELLGTFAMYCRQPRGPKEHEQRVLREAALGAAVAIQHWRTQDALLDAEERFRALTAHAANIVTVVDRNFRKVYVSPAVKTILGFEPSELVGGPVTGGIHPDDAPEVLHEIAKLGGHIGAQSEQLVRMQHKDGSWRTLETVGRSDQDRHGNVIIVLSGRDVTERERMTAALRDSESRLDRALTASGLGMWDWNIETGELFVDRQFSFVMGYPAESVAQRVEWMLDHVHPDDQPSLLDAFGRTLKGEIPYCEIEYRGQMESGEWRWLETRAQVTMRRADGWALRMTGTNKDIDERKRMQENLDTAVSRVQLLLDATDEGIIGLDDVGACTFVNPAALKMIGSTAGQVLGRDFSEIVRHTREDGEELLGHDSPIHRCLAEGRRYRSGSDELFQFNGKSFPVEVSVSPITTGAGNNGAVLAFHDVTEKRTLQRRLQFQAMHDPLTGLLNRRGFEQRLNHLLESARAEQRQHALCYLDLDQFKVVNDTCGHVAGDELLRQLPEVLGRRLRETDTLARLGGDEFALLLQDTTLDEAADMAAGLRDEIRDFRFVWQHRSFTIGVCIGVVGVTAESQGPVSVLGAADAACYVAKDQGPGSVHVSYPHDLAIVRRRGEMRWVARLRRAIEDNQFRMHFQSIAALDAVGAIPTHHELLLRLLDGKGGVILPGVFVPAAERYHLMTAVDRWVVENAMRHIAEFIVPVARFANHRFGINLSGESLRNRELLDVIEGTMKRLGIPPSMLYFEITETAAITNLSAAIAFMERLKELGCEMALDDFGSGMSSFSYLKHLPVDYLKIDGSFVRDIVNSRVDQSIVRAAHAVGQELGIATVAEHVETPETVERLREIGINYAQGFAIARPCAIEEFAETQQRWAASV